jgi:ribonuclease VapC
MFVLDSSALLAYIKSERGADLVEAALPNAYISVINYAETLAKLVEWGSSIEQACEALSEMEFTIVPCTESQAVTTAAMLQIAKQFGLSIGDRFCLALTLEMNCPVLTADKIWQNITLDVDIQFIS